MNTRNEMNGSNIKYCFLLYISKINTDDKRIEDKLPSNLISYKSNYVANQLFINQVT